MGTRINLKMHRLSIKILLFLVIISGFNYKCYAENSAKSEYTGIVTADSVNLRSGPGINFEILRKLDKDTLILVLGKKGKWLKIKLPRNSKAFVFKKFLKLGTEKNAIISGNRVNIRAGDGQNFNVIGQLNNNDKVEVLESKGEWVRIYPDKNCYAWINESYVKYHGHAEIYTKAQKRQDKSYLLLQEAQQLEKSYIKSKTDDSSIKNVLDKYQAVICAFPNTQAAQIASKRILFLKSHPIVVKKTTA